MTTAIAALFAEKMRKDNPTVADVHVSSTGGGKRPKRKAKMFSSAYVAKSNEWVRTVPISKMDEDQRLVFGWASVIEENGKPVIDQQGDIISERELENAFYGFAKDARIAGEMHDRIGVGELVECMVYTEEKCRIAVEEITGQPLPENWVPAKKGAWVGFRLAPDVFAKVKSGEYRAFSIGGRGARTAI